MQAPTVPGRYPLATAKSVSQMKVLFQELLAAVLRRDRQKVDFAAGAYG
jgi:hypothetical protein